MTEPNLALIQVMLERVLEGQRRAGEQLDRLVGDVGDIKVRMTAAEEAIAGVNRRLDRIEQRLDRIEKRSGLIDA